MVKLAKAALSKSNAIFLSSAFFVACAAILLFYDRNGKTDTNRSVQKHYKDVEKFLFSHNDANEVKIAPPSSSAPAFDFDNEILATEKVYGDTSDTTRKANLPSLNHRPKVGKESAKIDNDRMKRTTRRKPSILSVEEFHLASQSKSFPTADEHDAKIDDVQEDNNFVNKVTKNAEKYVLEWWEIFVEKFQPHGQRAVWVWTLLCSAMVMTTGVVPAFLIPAQIKAQNNNMHNEKDGACMSTVQLNRLLSFAVGSLLGDVFFHLLPESWNDIDSTMQTGIWIIAGLLACIIIEKFCSHSESSQHYIAAIANLIANIMDNFMHGLAVGGSFLVSTRLGFLTTFAILIHEIPHEISDFAILLRADFNRISAIKAQIITAAGGLVGAAVALLNGDSIDQKTNWILPFTAGGFLNIALVQVLPDIMKEKRFNESIRQLLLILTGIAIMGFLNSFHA